MKVPSDEEIKLIRKDSLHDSKGDSVALEIRWLWAKLEPLLDLIKQLREARKEFEAVKPKPGSCYFGDPWKLIIEETKKLEELRDKLELGE